jgi:hypothetical protein
MSSDPLLGVGFLRCCRNLSPEPRGHGMYSGAVALTQGLGIGSVFVQVRVFPVLHRTHHLIHLSTYPQKTHQCIIFLHHHSILHVACIEKNTIQPRSLPLNRSRFFLLIGNLFHAMQVPASRLMCLRT